MTTASYCSDIFRRRRVYDNEEVNSPRSISSKLYCLATVYRLLTDKKMELMVFGTSNIYRKSGTTAAHVEDEEFTAGLDKEASLKWVKTLNEWGYVRRGDSIIKFKTG